MHDIHEEPSITPSDDPVKMSEIEQLVSVVEKEKLEGAMTENTARVLQFLNREAMKIINPQV